MSESIKNSIMEDKRMNLVKIEDKELVIKEWNGERVVTAKDIAELHERDVKRVNEQFNIDKFELGKDYFQLTREEMRKSQFATALSKYSNNDIENLFTERGYLKLTKTFTDELSWRIQDILVDSYFALKKIAKEIKPISEFQIKNQEIRDRYSRAKMSKELLEIAKNTDNAMYKEILTAYAANTLADKNILPLPRLEQKTYTATEIGNIVGVSSKKIGMIANEYNLKTDENGYLAADKSPYSNKQVESFRYFEHAIEKFREALEKEKEIN